MSNQAKAEKPEKAKSLLDKIYAYKRTGFSPTAYIKIDDKFFK
jgi:hypothetical protein